MRIPVWVHLGASDERVSWDGQRLEVWVTLKAATGAENRTVEGAIGRALGLHPTAVAVVAGEVLVPLERLPVADALGLRRRRRWSTGDVTDLAAELGDNWRFGAWRHEEYDWCQQAYWEAEHGLMKP